MPISQIRLQVMHIVFSSIFTKGGHEHEAFVRKAAISLGTQINWTIFLSVELRLVRERSFFLDFILVVLEY